MFVVQLDHFCTQPQCKAANTTRHRLADQFHSCSTDKAIEPHPENVNLYVRLEFANDFTIGA